MELPTLQAMVLADKVYIDRATNKYLIIGTFGILKLRRAATRDAGEPNTEPGSEISGPVHVRSESDVVNDGNPSLYLALQGIRCPTTLRLRYQRLDDETVRFEGRIEVDACDPVELVEVATHLPSLAGPPGRYSLDLLCDGALLGQWRLTIVIVEDN